MIAGAGALLIAAGKPPAPRAFVKPPRLKAGDTVALIQPAGFTDDAFDIEDVKRTITAMGLVPKVAPHLTDRFGYLAGVDRDRAADINMLHADPEVKALFAVRGGWGCARILPYLDWTTIRANPKLLIGFSDITALHLAYAAKAGFTTIHGPVASSGWNRFSWDYFHAVAFDAEMPTFTNPVGHEDRLAQRIGTFRTFGKGKASGRLIGGNLTVLTALMGTPWLPDFSGAILFLEEVGEQPYRIDRMLTQLALGGVLRQVAGVVFGQCSECVPSGPAYGGFTVSELLDQHLSPLGIPVYQGAQFGHVASQFSLPVGIRAEMDADAGTIRLLEPAVV